MVITWRYSTLRKRDAAHDDPLRGTDVTGVQPHERLEGLLLGAAQRSRRRSPISVRRGAITLATASTQDGRNGYTSGRGRLTQRRIHRATCSADWMGPCGPSPARRASAS